jgi:hypothetical protein
MESHNGLDSLFVQVLNNAKEHVDFQCTLGVNMFLREHFPIGDLARFLQSEAYDIRSSFEGSLSILIVPDIDEDYIRPHHTSLLDFLTDQHRSKGHFLDPGTNHAALVKACASVIKMESSSDTLPSNHRDYAYQNWCYHLCLVLAYKNSFDISSSPFPSICNETAETLVSQQWTWLHRMGSYKKVEELLAKLREVISHVEVSDYK